MACTDVHHNEHQILSAAEAPEMREGRRLSGPESTGEILYSAHPQITTILFSHLFFEAFHRVPISGTEHGMPPPCKQTRWHAACIDSHIHTFEWFIHTLHIFAQFN